MRKHYLDNIRWATVLLVVLYHAIFMYNHVVTVGVVGPVTDCRWQDALQYLLYPWFMVVLFLVSGALARRGGVPAVRRSCLRRRAGAVCRAAPCAGGAVLCFRH